MSFVDNVDRVPCRSCFNLRIHKALSMRTGRQLNHALAPLVRLLLLDAAAKSCFEESLLFVRSFVA